MRTHTRYEQNGQGPPRKVIKAEGKRSKAQNVLKSEDQSINQSINNNDISMFNQNSLDKFNELRVKIQENLMANGGLTMPGELPNLNREIKIEF